MMNQFDIGTFQAAAVNFGLLTCLVPAPAQQIPDDFPATFTLGVFAK